MVTVQEGVYSERMEIPAGGIPTGDAIELPLGQKFKGSELTVKLNDTVCNFKMDYSYDEELDVKSSITFNFDLEYGDILEFEILDPVI